MLLKGKRGLVLNVVNKNSIGWKIAQAAADNGAKVGVGAQNERMAEGVQKLFNEDPRFDMFMIDFSMDEQFDALRTAVSKRYKKIDFVVHSAAYAPREALMGRFIDTQRDAFQVALDVSCYSLVKLCSALEPVLNDDASIMALT